MNTKEELRIWVESLLEQDDLDEEDSDEEDLDEEDVEETIYTKGGAILKRATPKVVKKMRWSSKLKKLVPQGSLL